MKTQPVETSPSKVLPRPDHTGQWKPFTATETCVIMYIDEAGMPAEAAVTDVGKSDAHTLILTRLDGTKFTCAAGAILKVGNWEAHT